VAGVHFDWRFSTPEDVGYRALAVNLSDLAAMGATPRWALLSLALPDEWPVAAFDGLLAGLLALAATHGVDLAGGNLTRTPGPLVVNVTVGGTCRPRRLLLRGGGRPGDELYVTGTLGAARAGLAMLRAGGRDADEECIIRYHRPIPRVRMGITVAQARAARAAIDLSDGLADAVRQVAGASGTGAVIEAGLIPVAPGARRWFEGRGADAVRETVSGGDDYELLLAVPPRWRGRLRAVQRRVATPGLTRIGVLTDRPGLVLRGPSGDEPLPAGYEHFRRTD
jgi:thiamine-monophosphate kinase